MRDSAMPAYARVVSYAGFFESAEAPERKGGVGAAGITEIR